MKLLEPGIHLSGLVSMICERSYQLELGIGPDPDMSIVCYPIPNETQLDIPDLAESVFRFWHLPTEVSSGHIFSPAKSG